jgi:hypothetical protein
MPKMPKRIEDRIQEETPYHENTKVRKHEKTRLDEPQKIL